MSGWISFPGSISEACVDAGFSVRVVYFSAGGGKCLTPGGGGTEVNEFRAGIAIFGHPAS
jgi:hypothetical protein